MTPSSSSCGWLYFLPCRSAPLFKQALRMRRAYVQCILKQDIGWFDANPAGQIPTAVTANMAKVQDGLGRKMGDIILNGLSGKCCGCFSTTSLRTFALSSNTSGSNVSTGRRVPSHVRACEVFSNLKYYAQLKTLVFDGTECTWRIITMEL